MTSNKTTDTLATEIPEWHVEHRPQILRVDELHNFVAYHWGRPLMKDGKTIRFPTAEAAWLMIVSSL